MPDINTLIANFLVNVGDPFQAATNPSDPDTAITAATLPETGTSKPDHVTHLIDGANYFGALKEEIASLLAGGTDRFFYTNSWSLGTSPTPGVVEIAEGSFTSAWKDDATKGVLDEIAFQLEDASGGPFHPFQDDIKAMFDAGVDVRFLVWASPFLVNLEQAAHRPGLMQFWAINVHSLKSIIDLRKIIGDDKVVINTLGHTLGAMHLKTVICGDNMSIRTYVTGIDFAQNRNTPPVHEPGFKKHYWHDVAIKIKGFGVNGVYHCFEQLWNEQVQRSAKTFKAFGEKIKSHVDGTPLVPSRADEPTVTNPTLYTQVLRTLPTMNFSFFKTDRAPLSCYERIVSSFKQKKLSFAPDGIFEFRAAQWKAVQHAQQYIYIEDQTMQNIELATLINTQMQSVPGLKVVLMYMGDPLDAQSPELFDMMDRLVAGLTNPEDRIVFAVAPYTIHSKLTIIDDQWASIGSANFWRRSLYMDGEINVSVVDEGNPSFAAKLRKDLWGEHCGIMPGPLCDPLLQCPLNDALGIWRDSWGTPPPGFKLRDEPAHDDVPALKIIRKTVPFVFEPCPLRTDDGLPPCPSLELHPEAMRGFEPPHPLRPPSPTKDERDREDGDSRLEY